MDVSVVLSFADHEESIGRAVRRIAEHLGSLGLRFEIVCVDEDSGDNSHAVLALLCNELAEIRVIGSTGRGRGFVCGAEVSTAPVLWLVTAEAALADITQFEDFYRRVSGQTLDVAAASDRFTVCRREAALELMRASRGDVHTTIARRALGRDLRVEHHRGGGGLGRHWPLSGRVQRLVASPLRTAFSWFDA